MAITKMRFSRDCAVISEITTRAANTGLIDATDNFAVRKHVGT